MTGVARRMVKGRLTGALAVLCTVLAGGGIVAAGTFLPAALAPVGAAPAQALPITLAAPTLVCPGPETLLVPEGARAVDPGGAVLLSALVGAQSGPATARVQFSGKSSGPAAQAARLLPAAAAPAPVSAPSLSLSASAGSADGAAGGGSLGVGVLAGTALGPAFVRAPHRSDASIATLAGVQSTLARSGDLRGLSATPCTEPAAESWLVGGGTGGGERLRLLLANPAPVPAVVDVSVYSDHGLVPAPSGEGVVVPAGGEVPLLVDALAPGLDAVAVHVSARTGRVRAVLHDSLLRGLAPGGVDDVTAGAAPARQQVVAGLSLVDGYARTAGDPLAAGSTSVRIAVPGAQEAVVRVRLLDSTGAVRLPQAAVLNVPAGSVADVPIAGVPSGTYTAVIDSDVPVVAGARIGRPAPARSSAGNGAGSNGASNGAAEFAWAPSTSALAGVGYVMLPAGARSTLSLAAMRGPGRLEVAEVHADGSLADPRPVEVAEGTSATLQLSPDAIGVRLSGFAGAELQGSLVATATDPRGTLISVLPLGFSLATQPPASAVQDARLGLR